VTNVVLSDEQIEFDTTAIGVPHLIKVSYFPNWQATGADGPYRAAPSLMVVVPTQRHVVLRFEDTWAETTGKAMTGVALAGLATWGYFRRKRRRALDESAA